MVLDRLRDLLNPGIYLLNRFKYATKFGLVITLFLIPVIVASVSIYLQSVNLIQFSEKEAIGLQYLTKLNNLLLYSQQHDALMGPSFYDPQLAIEFALVEERITSAELQIDEVDRKYGAILGVSQQWKELRAKRRHTRVRPAIDEIPIAAHAEYLRGILNLKQKIADNSNLILDPELGSYYVMNALVNNIPAFTQNVSDMRAIIVSLVSASKSQHIEERLMSVSALMAEDARRLERDLTMIGTGDSHYLNVSVVQQREIVRRVLERMDSIISNIRSDKYNESSADAYLDITNDIGNLYNLYDNLIPTLNALISERISGLVFWRNAAFLIVLLTVLIPLYLYLCFFVAVRDVINRLNEAADKMLEHDQTSGLVALDSRDELADIIRIFNRVATELVNTNAKLAGQIKEYEVLSQEVRRKNDELERFNKFMIGREVRMADIKKELIQRDQKIAKLEQK